jgi:hypothetical protein
MTMYETSDLHQRIERYETALDELRAAHQEIKNILHDRVLYERWQLIGADLGFSVGDQPPAVQHSSPSAELAGLNHQIPQMAESWSS